MGQMHFCPCHYEACSVGILLSQLLLDVPVGAVAPSSFYKLVTKCCASISSEAYVKQTTEQKRCLFLVCLRQQTHLQVLPI